MGSLPSVGWEISDRVLVKLMNNTATEPVVNHMLAAPENDFGKPRKTNRTHQITVSRTHTHGFYSGSLCFMECVVVQSISTKW